MHEPSLSRWPYELTCAALSNQASDRCSIPGAIDWNLLRFSPLKLSHSSFTQVDRSNFLRLFPRCHQTATPYSSHRATGFFLHGDWTGLPVMEDGVFFFFFSTSFSRQSFSLSCFIQQFHLALSSCLPLSMRAQSGLSVSVCTCCLRHCWHRLMAVPRMKEISIFASFTQRLKKSYFAFLTLLLLLLRLLLLLLLSLIRHFLRKITLLLKTGQIWRKCYIALSCPVTVSSVSPICAFLIFKKLVWLDVSEGHVKVIV